jgi:quinolinate synthase
MDGVIEKIGRLKAEKGAIILAHIYQRPEVQQAADRVGDSFGLSRSARDSDARILVFCGVAFMGESAKLLSPDKKVLLPVRDAGCPMAGMVTPDDVRRLRERHPGAAVVCYVNSSAAVKAESDICCTSSNAVRVVRSLPEKRIIFVPDRNLGRYVAAQVPDKEIILHDGHCPVHSRITARMASAALAAHPGAALLVHPECEPEVVRRADYVGSTAGILGYVRESDREEFIIGTEEGILYPLERDHPGKRFYRLAPDFVCADMKKITLPDVLASLELERYEVELDRDTAEKAARSLDRMLAVV